MKQPAPRDRVIAELESAGWKHEDALSAVPRRWEQHGDVVVVRPLDVSPSRQEEVAVALLKVLKARIVLVDGGGVGGELREPQKCTVLARVGPPQDNETEAVHVEQGVKYSFDARLIMFSSGNTTERTHAGTLGKGEVVVDMFAGIGYFTLPLARYGSPAHVYAIEKNENSFRFLCRNIRLNGVDKVVTPLLGDNRLIGDEALGRASRVLMGFFDGGDDAKPFLRRAAEFLQRGVLGSPTGVLHYHYLATKEEAWRTAQQHIRDELSIPCLAWDPANPPLYRRPDFASYRMKLALSGFDNTHIVPYACVEAVRKVKSYRPHIFHFVADIRLGVL
eukprot:Sspe_Gene.76933::Locus_48047_Transcript_1_1_Confidence_1.000_Length_1079::g.76933::m.76933/K07055/TRM12, TYW2; tRNA wybutosine-synthesizing protein 2